MQLHPRRLGTAQLADPEAIERNCPYQDGTFWLGRSVFKDGQASAEGEALGVPDDRHVLLVGGTRGGKGTSYIVPNLCLWPGSVFCVDPKGENAMLTADARAEGRNGHKQPVYVLDPFQIARIESESLRANFNPLWELMEPDPDGQAFGMPGDPDYEPPLRPVDHAVDEASIIASAIVVDGDGKGKSDHWNDNARRMIGALILHVISSPRFHGLRNLVTVRRLIMRGADDLAEICRAAGKEVESNQALLWNEVACNEAFDGVLEEDGSLFAELAKTDPEQFSGILSTAATHTDFLKSPRLRSCLKQSSFRLEELKTKKSGISVYLCLPLRFMQAEHYRWLRMLIGLATQQVEKTHGPCASGHKVLMMLDEFTALRRMRYLEEALTQYGGAGLTLFLAVQTLDRLRTVYPDSWQAFISQCGIKIFFNADDSFTREEVSKLVGETEISVANTGTSENATTTSNWTETDTTGDGESGSTAVGYGSSRQVAEATNWTNSEGGSRSQAHGRSSGGSFGRAHTESATWGTSYSGSSSLTQEGETSFLFGQRLTGKYSVSTGSSHSAHQGQGTSNSVQSQQNWGTSNTDTEGVQWNQALGGGRTVSEGDNHTTTTTGGWNRTRSHAIGKGGGESQGTGRTVNEQWHRRPIFLPEEVGRFFAGLGNRQDPRYPGLALVIVGGGLSMVVRRITYHEDYAFEGLFNPHKDYPFIPLPSREAPAAPEILAPAPEPLLLTDGSPPRRQHFLLFVLLGFVQLGLLLLLLVSYLFSGLHAVCLWLASFDHFALTGGLWLALAFGLWLWMSHAYWIDSGGKRAGVAAGISLLPVAFLWWLAPYYLRFDNWAAGLSAGYRHGFAAHWLLTGLGIAGLLVCDFYWLRGGTGRLGD